MATAAKHVHLSTRRSNAFGLLVAGGILFVLGFGGSSIVLGTAKQCHPGERGRA